MNRKIKYLFFFINISFVVLFRETITIYDYHYRVLYLLLRLLLVFFPYTIDVENTLWLMDMYDTRTVNSQNFKTKVFLITYTKLFK